MEDSSLPVPALREKCAICDNELVFRWTDTHGVATCSQCGCPYRLIHYDEKDQRIKKEPEHLILPKYLDMLRKYWKESKRITCPGAFMLPGSDREVAIKEDYEVLNKWLEARKTK